METVFPGNRTVGRCRICLSCSTYRDLIRVLEPPRNAGPAQLRPGTKVKFSHRSAGMQAGLACRECHFKLFKAFGFVEYL